MVTTSTAAASSRTTANRVLTTGRAPAEHGFAHLKNWRPSPNSVPTPPVQPASCAPCSS
ncbi:hypothetical protein ABZ545_00850 [Streptomyces abikoensis]|uniref:hypothetical protein n=1 Tax=Streptomyces abikoensis TaxID=97398 RepID=UPI003403EDB8